nr:hypothetical protein Iba_chr02bCG18960 [Ipomoea batatas]
MDIVVKFSCSVINQKYAMTTWNSVCKGHWSLELETCRIRWITMKVVDQGSHQDKRSSFSRFILYILVRENGKDMRRTLNGPLVENYASKKYVEVLNEFLDRDWAETRDLASEIYIGDKAICCC